VRQVPLAGGQQIAHRRTGRACGFSERRAPKGGSIFGASARRVIDSAASFLGPRLACDACGRPVAFARGASSSPRPKHESESESESESEPESESGSKSRLSRQSACCATNCSPPQTLAAADLWPPAWPLMRPDWPADAIGGQTYHLVTRICVRFEVERQWLRLWQRRRRIEICETRFPSRHLWFNCGQIGGPAS